MPYSWSEEYPDDLLHLKFSSLQPVDTLQTQKAIIKLKRKQSNFLMKPVYIKSSISLFFIKFSSHYESTVIQSFFIWKIIHLLILALF